MLTETRAADREAMARTIVAQAQALGASASIHPDANDPGRLVVRIDAARGLCVGVELRARSPHPIANTFVLAWHVDPHTPGWHDVRLAEAFAPGAVNTYHRQKATTFAHGFDALTRELARALRLAASGAAFEPVFAGVYR
jgi:hypothetical protein